MSTDAIPEPRYRSIVLPEMADNPLLVVYEHIKKTHGEEKLARIPDNIHTLPNDFKDGNRYYFFGSLRNFGGKVAVPCARWVGDKYSRGEVWLGFAWRPSASIVLLED